MAKGNATSFYMTDVDARQILLCLENEIDVQYTAFLKFREGSDGRAQGHR